MIGIDIIKTFDDPRLIGGYIKEQDNSFFNWKVFFKSIYAIPMDQKERKIYRKFTERRRPPKQPIESIYCVSGRKSGKSLIASCLAVYTSVFENFWKSHVRPGQKVYYPVIATDKVQAREVFQYCNGILDSNPIFREQVARSLTWEIELKNSVVILIRTANFKAVRGPLYIGAILDELAFMKDENSVNPADELIKGIMPGLIPGGKLIGISSAYAKFGILYSEYNKYFGKDDPNTLIWLSDTMSMNPFFNERKIERALKKDYSHARAEYYSAFREDIESYIPPELIDEMTVPGRFRLAKRYRAEYFAFLDPSGGRQDSFTLGISHKGRKKIVLDVLEERIPPFRPKNVVKEYVKILNRYGISKVYADHYAEAWVQESFEDLGIDIEYSDLTASELYLNFLPLLSNGAVELLDNKKLKAQFVGLERRTRPGGKDLVTHYSRGHDDLANVCAGSIVMVNMQGEEQPSWVYHLGMKEEEEAKEIKGKKPKKKLTPKPFGRLPEGKKKKEPEPRHDESWVM